MGNKSWQKSEKQRKRGSERLASLTLADKGLRAAGIIANE